MSEIRVIGIGSGGLDAAQKHLLDGCHAVVVSTRYRHLAEGVNAEILPIAPVRKMLDNLAAVLDQGSAAVLASGDPLFFGIGRTLINRFGPERVRLYPALSSMQLACARFRVPWDDMAFLSAHGRKPDDLPARILRHEKVMILTDSRNTPDMIARTLLDTLINVRDRARIGRLRVRVAENLGLDDERLVEGGLEEIAGQRFGPLNVVLVENEPAREREARAACVFGLDEDEITHSRGLITKNEVRAVALHRLRLPENGVFWDVGGGSGSVSMEAARLCHGLKIYCVEQKEEQQANICENVARYGTYNIHLVRGSAPEALEGLPDPDRVFIGGSGGRLEGIISHCARRLNQGGRLVINAVLSKTAEEAPRLLEQHGFLLKISKLQITRCSGTDGPEQELNPITIICGEK